MTIEIAGTSSTQTQDFPVLSVLFGWICSKNQRSRYQGKVPGRKGPRCNGVRQLKRQETMVQYGAPDEPKGGMFVYLVIAYQEIYRNL